MAKKNTKNKKDTKKNFSFAIPMNVFKGVYSNFALIKHTKREFIIDFVFQEGEQAELISRIIMGPEQMKDFQSALNRNIESFNSTGDNQKKINNNAPKSS